jgi:triacylglycerol esterase/lipase EstA (alpha/beta hydrolase family)
MVEALDVSNGQLGLAIAARPRRDKAEVRPPGTDAAFDWTVVVGHSMGGLLAKMIVKDSGSQL